MLWIFSDSGRPKINLSKREFALNHSFFLGIGESRPKINYQSLWSEWRKTFPYGSIRYTRSPAGYFLRFDPFPPRRKIRGENHSASKMSKRSLPRFRNFIHHPLHHLFVSKSWEKSTKCHSFHLACHSVFLSIPEWFVGTLSVSQIEVRTCDLSEKA